MDFRNLPNSSQRSAVSSPSSQRQNPSASRQDQPWLFSRDFFETNGENREVTVDDLVLFGNKILQMLHQTQQSQSEVLQKQGDILSSLANLQLQQTPVFGKTHHVYLFLFFF